MPGGEAEASGEPVEFGPLALGVKGAGEAGTVDALPAVISAVNDAMRLLGVGEIERPATPERLWRAIRSATAGQ